MPVLLDMHRFASHLYYYVSLYFNPNFIHILQRFDEEVEVLREKYGDFDPNILVFRLLKQEVTFVTVEVDDLANLKQRRPEQGRVYILGKSHFLSPPALETVDVATLSKKALVVVGDEELATAAREALPATTRTNKKVVELMGSSKVVTERKALKKLGSEMTDEMRMLQVRSEKREKEDRQEKMPTLAQHRRGESKEGHVSMANSKSKSPSPSNT